jgi:hypothetical protein
MPVDLSLLKKMFIKPDHRVLLLNAPEEFKAKFTELIDLDTDPDGRYAVVLLFVQSRAEVDTLAPVALAALESGGLFWVAYPKKTSKIKTDINRDAGWDVIEAAGYRGIAMVAIDETWAGLRFRPLTSVGL